MRKKEKNLAFISLAISCFLTVLDSTIINVSLPTMAKYFNTSITGISWVSTAYLIPFCALLINFSKIADIYGRKKLFLAGLIVFGMSSICCGISTTIYMIIFFRVLQGIGAAILAPLAIPLGIELFGKDAMGKLAIIVGMVISISAASGPVIGGVLNEIFGFKAIFYVNIPFILVSLVLGKMYVKECYDKTIEKKVDMIGSLLLAYGIGALTFLLVKGNSYGWSSKLIITMIITSLLSILGFLIYESRIKNPMIEFNLFKIKSYTASIALISVIFFAYMPVSYLMNFYLEDQLGYSTLKSGLILGIASVVSFLMSPIFAIISRKVSVRLTSFLAVVFVSLGDLTLTFVNSTNHIRIIYAAFIIAGLGIGATTPLYQSAFEEVPKDKNGVASGIQNSIRQVAACIAIALVSTLSTHYSGIAVDNVKNKITNYVNQDTVIEQKVKNVINSKMKNMKSDEKSGFSRKIIHNMVEKQESKVLKGIPQNMRTVVKIKFKKQEKEIYKVIDKARKVRTDEINKVYSKCFLIVGIIDLLGLIAVPFNKVRRRKIEEDALKTAM
ncbi:MFS transporter [Clostridium oryzae]|uniref:Multidrug resistance protein Stp n=1 Tax=Clostridium oryzae TaxID=1450648 RepID=A0A1V4IWN5_9CLOT|nr:MFS transporter [Clostridium oryzae]OPJ64472.1 multidrug resistance protein Stp [Clostridium oryzae]